MSIYLIEILVYAVVDHYFHRIPPHNRLKLDEELDYDNDVDRDLIAVADNMINWEVNLKVPLGLTEADVYRIKQERDSVLRQYVCCR